LRRYSEKTEKRETPEAIEIVNDLIFYHGKALSLTPAEFDILSQLIAQKNRAISREQLINTSRSMSIDSHHKSLDMIISKLRSKLGDPELIKTVRGVGYRLQI
jgi:two-component system OmpR family response regulator